MHTSFTTCTLALQPATKSGIDMVTFDLSKIWPVTLILSSTAILFGLEIAIFGIVPGITSPADIQNTAMIAVLTSALLNIVTFIAGFGHDLRRNCQSMGIIQQIGEKFHSLYKKAQNLFCV